MVYRYVVVGAYTYIVTFIWNKLELHNNNTSWAMCRENIIFVQYYEILNYGSILVMTSVSTDWMYFQYIMSRYLQSIRFNRGRAKVSDKNYTMTIKKKLTPQHRKALKSKYQLLLHQKLSSGFLNECTNKKEKIQ